MSSYINFYVERNNVYIPVGDYSRNNPMYRCGENFIPYEGGRILDHDVFGRFEEEFEEEIKDLKNSIERYNKENELIKDISGATLNEKLERITENESFIEECKEELDLCEAQLNHLRFLYNINDDYDKVTVWVGIEWDPNYKEEEN